MKYLYKRIYQVKGLCMLVLMICVIPINVYAVCSIQNEIETVIDGVVLDELIQGWQNNDLLNKYCYVSIGIKYFQFYRTTSNTEDLNHAIRYLEYAENNLREQDQPYYNNCYTYLLRAESFRVPPNIENILRYNQRISGANTITDQEVIRNIRSAATQAANNYLRDPFRQNYPQTMMQSLAGLGITTLGIADRISQINERITEFRRRLRLLQNNQTLSTIQSILEPITFLENMSISTTNIPQVSALRHLQNYYNIYNNTNADDRCTQLGIALSSLEIARNTFNYLDDTLQVECHKGFICLSRDIQRDFNNNILMPDHKLRNDYNNRLRRCQDYLTQYRNRIAQCNGVQITRDQQSKLNNIVAFYEAYNCLTTPPQGCTPTSLLEQFMTGIQEAGNIEYATELYNLAGFHIADYFFQRSYNLLCQGPGENREQTLNRIFALNTRLNNYKDYIKLPVNVLHQRQLLIDFFDQYQTNPNATAPILRQIKQEIKNAWSLQPLLRNKFVEIQRQEDQQIVNQPADQPEVAHVADQPENDRVDNRRHQPDQQNLIQQPLNPEVNIRQQNNELIPGEEQKIQYIRQAQRAFNNTDYIESWRLYGYAFPNIIPARLNDLYTTMGRYQNAEPGLVWTVIPNTQRQRIEILCMIMNMNHQSNVRRYITNIINRRKGYTNLELVWQISEPDHETPEKVSDTYFFVGLHHLLSGDSTNIQIIYFFLDSYHQLINPLQNYVGAPLSRVKNKKNRIYFWLKKAWPNYSEAEKIRIWNERNQEYPEIFGPVLQLPGAEQVANIDQIQENQQGNNQQGLQPGDVNGVSNNQYIATFETYAKAMLQLTEPISCEFVRQHYPQNNDTNPNDCLTRIKDLTYRSIRSKVDRFRFYYALALIRKAQQDPLNWIENIAIAYINIPNDANRGQRQAKLKRELAEAKLCISNNSQIQITARERQYLAKAQLDNDWDNSNFIRTHLDFFDGPNYVQAELQSIACIGGETNISVKRNFLTKLLNTYLIETDIARKSEYTSIYHSFINDEQCISQKEKTIWQRRFYSN